MFHVLVCFTGEAAQDKLDAIYQNHLLIIADWLFCINTPRAVLQRCHILTTYNVGGRSKAKSEIIRQETKS